METVEVVIYLTIAVILGGIFVMFIAGIKPEEIYHKIGNIFIPDKTPKYESLQAGDLAAAAYRLWESCNFGAENKSVTVYVSEGNPITTDFLFQTFIKFNLCYSIQSASQGCGSREDVLLPAAITPPAVVTISCDATTKKLVIQA